MCVVVTACTGSQKPLERSAPVPPAVTTAPLPTPSADDVVTAAPRWEAVTELDGSRDGSAEVHIDADAIQWRVRWRCSTGRLRLSVTPSGHGRPLVDAACPGQGDGYSIVTGAVRLQMRSAGPWRAEVEQQVETPLREPPLAGMRVPVAQGRFLPVEMHGRGTARLFALPGGRHAVRLENFEVSKNTDLYLWASEAPAARTSADAVNAPYVVLGELKATAGEQNYLLPVGLDPSRVRSLIVWCEPVRIAYAAATLTT